MIPSEHRNAACYFLTAILVLASCVGGCNDKKTASPGIKPKTTSNPETIPIASAPTASVPSETSPSVTHEVAQPVPELTPTSTAQSYALLVGCTTYDNLGEESWLRGPINDVKLVREMLEERFGFPANNIRTLSEDPAANARPLKQNIAKELSDLEQKLSRGDRVVLLLSGHGSQQPNDDPDDPEDPEPDGLDEIFCPADIDRPKDIDHPFAINALTDDELRVAIKALRRRGAFVWVIVDCCHSGSAIRGTEVRRQIAPEKLVGMAAILDAKSKTRTGTRGVARDESVMDAASPEEGGLVAIYAAQPNEPTLEMMLPDESVDSKWRGLLTYTLVEIITSAQTPLTYRELVQRIHNEYIMARGRLGPTPLIEGLDQNRQILGDEDLSSRASLVLTADNEGRYTINAGRLHGFSTGTVFAVFPPPGEVESTTPLGHVQVVRSQLASSAVALVEFDGLPVNRDLPLGGRVKPVEIRCGDLLLKIAFDDQSRDKSTSVASDAVESMLREISQDPDQRIELVSATEHADWFVRRTETHELYLVPSQGWSKVPNESYFGPAPKEDQASWFRDRLGRIARVKNLLKLCDASEKQSGGIVAALLGSKKACDIKIGLFGISQQTDALEAIDWPKRNWKLSDGEQVALQVKNVGSGSNDFSVFFIDSKFGITPLFPPAGVVADNRLQPGQMYTVGPMQVESSTLGLEHLFVIATKAEGQPLDFSWLGQNSLEAAKRSAKGLLGSGAKNNLEDMLQSTLFSKQKVRGMRVSDAEGTCLRAVSWQTISEK